MDTVIRDRRNENENKNKNLMNERIESIIATVHGEIRKVTPVKEIYSDEISSEFLELICEDDELNRFTLKDKNIKNEYKAGTRGTFTLQLSLIHI